MPGREPCDCRAFHNASCRVPSLRPGAVRDDERGHRHGAGVHDPLAEERISRFAGAGQVKRYICISRLRTEHCRSEQEALMNNGKAHVLVPWRITKLELSSCWRCSTSSRLHQFCMFAARPGRGCLLRYSQARDYFAFSSAISMVVQWITCKWSLGLICASSFELVSAYKDAILQKPHIYPHYSGSSDRRPRLNKSVQHEMSRNMAP